MVLILLFNNPEILSEKYMGDRNFSTFILVREGKGFGIKNAQSINLYE